MPGAFCVREAGFHLASLALPSAMDDTIIISVNRGTEMENKTWPSVLMICGFGVAAACLVFLLFTPLSSSANVAVSIGESLGIGIGSTGLGARIALAKRNNKIS